jgi:hypothetical protein
MQVEKNYTPEVLVFAVPEQTAMPAIMPTTAGADLRLFLATHFTCFNEACLTERIMDDTEMAIVRDNYRLIIEDEMPELEATLRTATEAVEKAKIALNTAKETQNAAITRLMDFGHKARHGTAEHVTNATTTYKVPLTNQYYYYTISNNQLVLCKVEDIPVDERNDLYVSQNNNAAALAALLQAPQAANML